ncbi:carbohydrate kinase family protein [Candidatus Babeliales bacterium]|nr:carbohydrate kinase family protein [Candidatus Babeliales bacterium]
MKVLTIGGATQDIFICCQQKDTQELTIKHKGEECLIFRCGDKIKVSELKYFTGGGSTNSAVSFKKLGFDVECFCKIGDDEAGMHVIKKLKEESVETQKIIITNDKRSGTSFIISSESGEQTVFTYRGTNGELKEEDLPIENLNVYDQLYITSLSNNSAKLLPLIVKKAKEFNINIAINPGSGQLKRNIESLKEALPFINTFILNKYEAQTLMSSLTNENEFEIKEFVKLILKLGPTIVAVTDGSNGVWVAKEKTLLFHPAMNIKVVGCLGAGDAFGSCFVGVLAKTGHLENALRCGIINSASVISQIGTKNGLLPYDKLEIELKSLDKNLLQITTL